KEFDRKLDDARAKVKQLANETARPPARFDRVPREEAIAAAIAMPPGAGRNTELTLLFSELDPASARVLYRRLEPREPDPEDALANAFKGVTDARDDLLGILAGTKKVRSDPRRFRRPERTPAGDPEGDTAANTDGPA